MRKSFLLFAVLLLSLLANVALFFLWQNDVKNGDQVADLQKKYPYLSKRVLTEFPQDLLINFLDLRTQLRSQVAPYGNTFGFYFEYLPTGTSIGVNDKNEFHAASLFKLPVIMAYYHFKDRTHTIADPVVSIRKDQIDKQFGDLWRKGPGYKIKVSEGIRLALQESDNTAAKLVVPFIEKQDFDSVYEGLDIDLDTDRNGAILTAKNYSSIMKSLYFSSVISKDSSEEILDYLTKTKFPDKLAAGVPVDVPVAHKIGDYNDDKGNEAFMDCGIIYVPRRPYLLCMVSVTDEQTARERMQIVSKIVYDYVSSVEK